MIWLRLELTPRILCLSNPGFTDQMQAWLQDIGLQAPAYAFGSLTLPSSGSIVAAMNTAIAYAQAPDNVVPADFAFLAANWSIDCVVVNKITVSQGPNAVQDLTDANAGSTGLQGVTNAVWAQIKSVLNWLLTATETVVGVALLLAALVALVYYKPWKYL